MSGKNWQYHNKQIQKDFSFETYMEGISFSNKIAELAEAHNHHPDLKIGYCNVSVSITSHDLGGVSTKCVNLALSIDGIMGDI